MRILSIASLFLTINLIRGQNYQGYNLGETQIREKRNNNIYQFLQHLLVSSSSNFGFPQNNFPPVSYSSPFYHNSGQERVVVNVNQPDSKPTTIINNLQPEYFSTCPCERYVRRPNGELDCLCPKKQIFMKCSRNTVCVLKNVCDHGLLFDTQYIQHGYNSQSDLCDELTHVCCLPPTEIRKEFGVEHQINNHFVNTSVDRLNNTVTKYVIAGNVYLNNGNPVTQFKTKNEENNKYGTGSTEEPNTVNMFGTISQEHSSSGKSEEEKPYFFPPVDSVLPNGEKDPVQLNLDPTTTTQSFTSIQGVSLSGETEESKPYFRPPQDELVSKFQSIQLNLDSTTSTERHPSIHTAPPNLVRPTRPQTGTFSTTQAVFDTKIKDDQQNNLNTFTNDISTYRPKIQPTSTDMSVPVVSEESTTDLLQPNEIESIFGIPEGNNNLKNPDSTVFPGFAAASDPVEGINLKASTETAGVSILENIPLSQMEFPQPNLQVPMQNPEKFLSGKIEKLRNSTRTNTTTAVIRVTQGVGTRIFVDEPRPTNVFPTNAPAFNQVSGESFNFQEPIPTEYMPPSSSPSNFATPSNTNTILRACPSSMKCVQNMYCTPEGYVSSVPVILTKEEEGKKNLLLTCGDESLGQIGKCCFDRNA